MDTFYPLLTLPVKIQWHAHTDLDTMSTIFFTGLFEDIDSKCKNLFLYKYEEFLVQEKQILFILLFIYIYMINVLLGSI